jgi:hypothetical protein
MEYISIDGDDVGRKITSFYLSNNQDGLAELSLSLKSSTEKISAMLEKSGFNVVFCAADGVVASTELTVDIKSIFKKIQKLAPNGVTFSAGIGGSLRESYIALTSAKCNGKNCLHEYPVISSQNEGINDVQNS